MNFNKLVTAALIGAGILLSGPVMADQRCKKVQIFVANAGVEDIKIFKIKYFDLEDWKWRYNNIRNVVLTAGTNANNAETPTRTVLETLEYVGNEEIGDVQIQYRKGVNGSRQWSDRLPSGIANCRKYSNLHHTITY